jgi:hypothetical protein
MSAQPVDLDDGLPKLQAFIGLLTQSATVLRTEVTEMVRHRHGADRAGQEARQRWDALETELQDAELSVARGHELAEEAMRAAAAEAERAAQADLPQAAGAIDAASTAVQSRLDGAAEALDAAFARFHQHLEERQDGIEQHTHAFAAHVQETVRLLGALQAEVEAGPEVIADAGQDAGQAVEAAVDAAGAGRVHAAESLSVFAQMMENEYLQALVGAADGLEPELSSLYGSFRDVVARDIVTPMWEQLSAVAGDHGVALLLEQPLTVLTAVAGVLEHPAAHLQRAVQAAAALCEDAGDVIDDAGDLTPDLKRSQAAAAEMRRLLQELGQ